MTKEEFIKNSGLNVGDIITTNREKLRELHRFVEKSNNVWGIVSTPFFRQSKL
jgi:hypothetical protein